MINELAKLRICDPCCGGGAILIETYAYWGHALLSAVKNALSLPHQSHRLNFVNLPISPPIFAFDIDEKSLRGTRWILYLQAQILAKKLYQLIGNRQQPPPQFKDLTHYFALGDTLINDKSIDFNDLPPNVIHPLSVTENIHKKLSHTKTIKTIHISDTINEAINDGFFDVVVMNPPYVQLQKNHSYSQKLANCHYESFHAGADLYVLFIERALQMTRTHGWMSAIVPNKWLVVNYAKKLRKYLLKFSIQQVLNFANHTLFTQAQTSNVILSVNKTPNTPLQNTNPVQDNHNLTSDVVHTTTVRVLHGNDLKAHELLNNNHTFSSQVMEATDEIPLANLLQNTEKNTNTCQWHIMPRSHRSLLATLNNTTHTLADLPLQIHYGIKTGYNRAFYIDEQKRAELIAKHNSSAKIIVPLIRGRDIYPYYTPTTQLWQIATTPSRCINIDDFPAIKAHLASFGIERLTQKGVQKGGRKKTGYRWFETQDSVNYIDAFEQPKIIYPNMTSTCPFTWDETGAYCNQKAFIMTLSSQITFDPMALLALLNARSTRIWISATCPDLGQAFEISKAYFQYLPIPDAFFISPQNHIKHHVNHTKSHLINELATLARQCYRYAQSHFSLQEPSTRRKIHTLKNADFSQLQNTIDELVLSLYEV